MTFVSKFSENMIFGRKFTYEFERFPLKYNNFTTLFAGQQKLRRVKFAEEIEVDARTFGRHFPFPERVKNLNVTGILIKFSEGDTNFLLSNM